MFTIPKINDKNKALKIYLTSNLNDREGDSWIFGHNPTIINFLNTYSSEEYEKLELEIEEWEDELLYNLADPVGECSNEAIDGSYIYCKIFNRISCIEKLEYLIQNLGAYTWSIKGKYPKEFYDELLKKSSKVNILLNLNYNYTIEQINKKKTDENKA